MKASSSRHKRIKKIAAIAGAFVFWMAVWQLAHIIVGRDFLLASPAQTLLRMLRLLGERVFWHSFAMTGLRVLIGFFLAITLGSVLAVLSSASPGVKTLLAPFFGAVRATPVVSFILLALIWMTSGTLPVFTAFLMVLPLAYANLIAGIGSIDRQLLEMARLFRFPRRRVLRLIYIPGLAPYFTAACATGLGIAWKAAVAAEVIARPALSVGNQIHRARIYLDATNLFAWTLAVIIISLVLEKGAVWALQVLEHRLLRIGREGGAPHA